VCVCAILYTNTNLQLILQNIMQTTGARRLSCSSCRRVYVVVAVMS